IRGIHGALRHVGSVPHARAWKPAAQGLGDLRFVDVADFASPTCVDRLQAAPLNDPRMCSARASTGRSTVGVLTVALLAFAACNSQPPQPPATEAAESYETSFTGYLSKTYPSTFEDAVAGSKAALEKLGFNVTGESGALFAKVEEAESEDGTTI